MTGESLADGEFTRLNRKENTLPGNKARHGTVIAISDEEYERIVKKYGMGEEN